MPGRHGGYTTTNQNLMVVKVDTTDNYILVKGNIPGPKKGLVVIKTTVKPVKEVTAPELVSYAEAESEGK
jgi:large subunit ribosomal protein L3